MHDGHSDEARTETPNHAGWATFEARVRGRRFGRCVERAALALDLGNMDDARAALDEARALSPDAPEIAELESRLGSQSSPNAVSAFIVESKRSPSGTTTSRRRFRSGMAQNERRCRCPARAVFGSGLWPRAAPVRVARSVVHDWQLLHSGDKCRRREGEAAGPIRARGHVISRMEPARRRDSHPSPGEGHPRGAKGP